ncbi:hypothetical protein CTAYLR_008269 [Chrysophaeum taylorii]|uniref:J domain-containing protein n=1 Tax=Chrysophaeum taylorii TaxID=2483200 RepID=A0AAD7XL79_9STRA|nr:hypothetical protein CTAYLR_008269 [Chrysophaeum taylorii]
MWVLLVVVGVVVVGDESFEDIEGVDLYATLGVTPSATTEELRKAYHGLARQLHPDKGGDAKKMAEVSRAFEILSDRAKRRKWEQWRPARSFDLSTREVDPAGPPRSNFWDKGSGLFAVDELFIPRGHKKLTRVTTLDDKKFYDAQDYELENGQWTKVGKPYEWNEESSYEDVSPHVLNASTPLFSGEHLVARDGSHDASVEPDGHLRVRESGSRRIVWQSGAEELATRPGFVLLQRDGNLVVCSGHPDAVQAITWASNSRGKADRLELNQRGELRIFHGHACTWGTHGCYASWRGAQNALRVTVRRIFDRNALRADSTITTTTTLGAIWSFLKYYLWGADPYYN